MLRRKIEDYLLKWKNNKNKKPLVIKGVRQCGKSYIVKHFANNNYENVIYLDFFKNSNLSTAFDGSLEIDNIITLLSTLVDDVQFVPNKTIIILDEIQFCPNARTSLKYFQLDGRFDVIATGSLLGVSGYSNDENPALSNEQPRSVPVGYEELIEMYPLDFEEFLWANNIPKQTIDILRDCYINETKVPEAIHIRMNELLRLYMVVGGMPAVVNEYLTTKQMNNVLRLQRYIINEYRDDMVKYAYKKDKAKIRQAFNSIPNQLAKEYKKFQYSKIKHGARANEYESSLQWIEDAGIIRRCYNLYNIELPLQGNKNEDEFKVYINDPGLLVAMFEDGTQFNILQDDLHIYKGAIYENLVAGFFIKMPKDLYYFHKNTLECDFIIRYKNKPTIVEVKANTGNSASINNILSNYDKYHVDSVIKLGNYNIGRSNNILTLPTYLGFLLTEI